MEVRRGSGRRRGERLAELVALERVAHAEQEAAVGEHARVDLLRARRARARLASGAAGQPVLGRAQQLGVLLLELRHSRLETSDPLLVRTPAARCERRTI